jgi:hypothetical protein
MRRANLPSPLYLIMALVVVITTSCVMYRPAVAPVPLISLHFVVPQALAYCTASDVSIKCRAVTQVPTATCALTRNGFYACLLNDQLSKREQEVWHNLLNNLTITQRGPLTCLRPRDGSLEQCLTPPPEHLATWDSTNPRLKCREGSLDNPQPPTNPGPKCPTP